MGRARPGPSPDGDDDAHDARPARSADRTTVGAVAHGRCRWTTPRKARGDAARPAVAADDPTAPIPATPTSAPADLEAPPPPVYRPADYLRPPPRSTRPSRAAGGSAATAGIVVCAVLSS